MSVICGIQAEAVPSTTPITEDGESSNAATVEARPSSATKTIQTMLYRLRRVLPDREIALGYPFRVE